MVVPCYWLQWPIHSHVGLSTVTWIEMKDWCPSSWSHILRQSLKYLQHPNLQKEYPVSGKGDNGGYDHLWSIGPSLLVYALATQDDVQGLVVPRLGGSLPQHFTVSINIWIHMQSFFDTLVCLYGKNLVLNSLELTFFVAIHSHERILWCILFKGAWYTYKPLFNK
jgi:hypothetical protein